MPTLHWIGKEKIINHHLEVPYKVLNHEYTSPPTPKGGVLSGNMIINGDNLEALKSLLPKYEGKVNCIYIDPPYNTGNESWVYNDNVNSPQIKKWLGKVVGKESEDLTRHDKWLCMMYPRLKLLHKLLSKDGAIFISIDENELYNLQIIMDEIFGKGNFVGQYNWFKSATPPNLSFKIKKNLEYILCYSKKSNSDKFTGIKKESTSDDPFTKPQNSYKDLSFPKGIINIKLEDQIIEKGIYGTTKFPNQLLDDLIIKNGLNENDVRFRNRFIWVQDKLNEEILNNTKININSKSLVLSYKKENYNNEVPPNLIDEQVDVETTENAGRELLKIFGEKVFDYPKPHSLIEYLINFLCNKNSIILDSFAGSGTTAHAVLNLNKQDGGNRKFILIEMEDYAETITAERVKRVINGYADKEGTGGSFDYYTLGEPLFDENNNLNENVGIEKIREYVWFTETRNPFPVTDFARNEAMATPFLGNHNETAYYFIYEKDNLTTLDYDSLAEYVQQKAERYIIYADNCLLPETFLREKNIEFKKIPRDITRF
ncbi:putative type III modification methyltransferase [Flavobacterium branchiophilum]|uniref:site-specific DNA-methyltransferase (adenine-specific) n=1 Tax=Flavobacterium branchiophilum (strain FL-15) TaxID=1034807 RepID=G2Z4X2_FLABF|nr:site-specific DNA-methyltransferase [Flavobacterium branchiophilum]CCB70684.1 Probable type III modification methyltransferase [Flavobacterium branchiophilum FL-15]